MQYERVIFREESASECKQQKLLLTLAKHLISNKVQALCASNSKCLH